MNRSVLLAYQLLTGLSDTSTGILLIVAPAFTLGLMRVHVPFDALPFLSYIGAFVLSVGLACCYGALLAAYGADPRRLETVWLLTAFTRSAVAIFVVMQILAGTLEPAWLPVAGADGACAVIQAVGLHKGWLANVAR